MSITSLIRAARLAAHDDLHAIAGAPGNDDVVIEAVNDAHGAGEAPAIVNGEADPDDLAAQAQLRRRRSVARDAAFRDADDPRDPEYRPEEDADGGSSSSSDESPLFASNDREEELPEDHDVANEECVLEDAAAAGNLRGRDARRATIDAYDACFPEAESLNQELDSRSYTGGVVVDIPQSSDQCVDKHRDATFGCTWDIDTVALLSSFELLSQPPGLVHFDLLTCSKASFVGGISDRARLRHPESHDLLSNHANIKIGTMRIESISFQAFLVAPKAISRSTLSNRWRAAWRTILESHAAHPRIRSMAQLATQHHEVYHAEMLSDVDTTKVLFACLRDC